MTAIASHHQKHPYQLLIAIGNTRIKAVVIDRDRHILAEYAHTHDQLAMQHMAIQQDFPQNFDHIAIASVVPYLLTPWHDLPQTQILTTTDVPLGGLYDTMGCDRAIAVFGAGEIYGYPVLVIDAGTAITITGIDTNKNLIGGAIIAGLRSQFASLHKNTASLPDLNIPEIVPTLWAKNTVGAIQSGIVQMILAGLRVYVDDWRSRFPDSAIVITGGDGDRLKHWGLEVDIVNSNLIFWGMSHLTKCQFNESAKR